MRDGARQSAVLLKNANNLLPLKLSSISSALAVGPNVAIDDTFTYYAGSSCNGTYNHPSVAITQYIPSASVILGVPDVGSGNVSGVPAAAAAAATADLVVLMVGSDLMLEREGHDRTSIDFSDGQKALIAAVTAASKNPVVALVMSGGAMDISALLANDKISAIIHCGQMSTQIVGVGDVIFGATPDGRPVAPAARMSQMIASLQDEFLPTTLSSNPWNLSCLFTVPGRLRQPGQLVRFRHETRAVRLAARDEPGPYIPILHRHARHPLRLRPELYDMAVHPPSGPYAASGPRPVVSARRGRGARRHERDDRHDP